MFRSKVFREQALSHRARPEPLDARLQVTAPHEWVALLALAAALAALLLWGVFGAVERSVTASAVVVQSGERRAVSSLVSGQVAEVLVDVGDAVAKGQAIARVRPDEARRQARLARRLLDAIAENPALRQEAAAVRQMLLDTASDELQRIERAALEPITAPRQGTLVSHDLVLGQPVRVGETVAWVRGRSEKPWQALAFLPAADAGRVAPGMAAEVTTMSPGGGAPRTFAARVVAASDRPVAAPRWLADLGLSAAGPAHLLRLAIHAHKASDAPLVDGAGGKARVVLGRRSVAALLLASEDG